MLAYSNNGHTIHIMTEFEGGLASPEMAHLDNALRRGGTIQAWQSASGLRMVRVVSPSDDMWAWGKAPNIDPALVNTAIDFKLGHIPNAYGESGLFYPYMVGNKETTSTLDVLLRNDGELKAFQAEDEVVCELTGSEFSKEPGVAFFNYMMRAAGSCFAEAVSLALIAPKEDRPRGYSTFKPHQE
jgi:hypothetical protein